jgi:serralysin
VSASSPLLESLETIFHQDLNGDGVIGLPANTTLIEAFGSTSLVEGGTNFYLDSISSGAGPELKDVGAAVVAGQYGAWAPIGAEQTATGYEVAWKVTGVDQYTVWNTDSNGNRISDTGILAGASNTLESLETSFHQDLNGDGVIGLAVKAGATLELAGAASGSVTFISSTGTLRLDAPSTFTGQIFGFIGDGSLAGSDQIDLTNLNYNTAIQSHSTYNSSTGVLAVNNGASTVNLAFFGSYSQANFKFASDGHGGTVVYDPPTVLSGAKDAASVEGLLAAIHHDSHGNSVVAGATHETITVQDVAAVQLLAHQVDFFFV